MPCTDNFQAFFTAILGRIGVKGAKIEEVLSVDEDTLATLPLVAPRNLSYMEGNLANVSQCSGPRLSISIRVCRRRERRGHGDKP